MQLFKLVELFGIHLDIRAQEIQMRSERLPFALAVEAAFGQLVAFAFVHVEYLYLLVFLAARKVEKNGGALAQIADHVAADIATEDWAGQCLLEQYLYHFDVVSIMLRPRGSVENSTEKRQGSPVFFSR
jgi:hypothetical protein